MFLSIDGDRIGKILEQYILDEKLEELSYFSKNIKKDVNDFVDIIEENDGHVYMDGGDNLFASIENDYIDKIVKYVKEKNMKSATARSNYHIICDGDNEAVTSVLNMSFMLLTSMKQRWSRRQHEIIKDYMEFHDGQTACAKRLGITQSSVQKGLANADFYTYDEVIKHFSEAFEQIH